MDPVNYSYIPVSISLFLHLYSPYLHNLSCMNTWITPPAIICKFVYIGLNVIFGILLWKAKEVDDDLLFGFVWALFVINLSWIYFYKTNKKTSLLLLFLSLLFGYFVYNCLFLSRVTRNSPTAEATPLYLNIFSVYLLWVGLMITILIESVSPTFSKKFLTG